MLTQRGLETSILKSQVEAATEIRIMDLSIKENSFSHYVTAGLISINVIYILCKKYSIT